MVLTGRQGQDENAGGLQLIPSFSQVNKSNLDEGECKQVATSSSERRVYILGFAARKSYCQGKKQTTPMSGEAK